MKMMVIVVMIIMMMVISDHLPIIRNCADNIFPEGGNEKPRSLFPPTCDEKIHCEETGNYHALSCIIMNYLGFKQKKMIIAATCPEFQIRVGHIRRQVGSDKIDCNGRSEIDEVDR